MVKRKKFNFETPKVRLENPRDREKRPMQLCTKIRVMELSEPDMFGQVWVTRAEWISTDLVDNDHRHDSESTINVGEIMCVRSGPLIVKTPAMGDCREGM